jgi:hypothetical protein
VRGDHDDPGADVTRFDTRSFGAPTRPHKHHRMILVLVFLSGFWWRWDSPDIRNPGNERSRRGF